MQSTDSFFYEYVTAWGFASAATELLQYLEDAKNKRDFLLAKKEGKQVNKFNIGG